MADADELREEVAEMEKEETTLVRIVEWFDWIPAEKSRVTGAPFHATNGITSFQTLKNERLLELGVSGTGKNYEWEEDEDCVACEGTGRKSDEVDGATEAGDPCDNCDGTGKVTVALRHGLYAFQAVLAQNTSRELATALQRAQAQPMLEELARDQAAGGTGRDKREDLVVIQRGQNAKPNRKARRKKR